MEASTICYKCKAHSQLRYWNLQIARRITDYFCAYDFDCEYPLTPNPAPIITTCLFLEEERDFDPGVCYCLDGTDGSDRLSAAAATLACRSRRSHRLALVLFHRELGILQVMVIVELLRDHLHLCNNVETAETNYI